MKDDYLNALGPWQMVYIAQLKRESQVGYLRFRSSNNRFRFLNLRLIIIFLMIMDFNLLTALYSSLV